MQVGKITLTGYRKKRGEMQKKIVSYDITVLRLKTSNNGKLDK